MAEWDGERLARLRQGLYRFFAASLLYPHEERLALLLEASGLLEGEGLHTFAFYVPWQRLAGALQGEVDLDGLEREFVRLFLVSTEGPLLPPQESFYLAPPGPATGLIMAEVERGYTRMGLSPSPDLKSYPDHASVEMEAMAFLCGREALAWKEGAFAGAIGALEGQRSFSRRHLGRWFPLFAERAMRVAGGGLYGLVVEAADAFMKHDRDLVDLLIQGMASAGAPGLASPPHGGEAVAGASPGCGGAPPPDFCCPPARSCGDPAGRSEQGWGRR